MRLPRLRRPRSIDEHEQWMATATMYARKLTETGSRCHRHGGSVRFCHWQAEELPSDRAGAPPSVGVRCTIHPGGCYLDSSARLAPEDFASTE